MGLVSDTFNDWIVDPVTDTWDSTVGKWTGTQTEDSSSGGGGGNGNGGGVNRNGPSPEDSFNEGAQETTDGVENVADEGGEGVFSLIQGGIDTVEGLFNSIAGAFEWSKGFADLPVVKDSPVAPAWDFVAEGGAGVFHAIAGVFAFVEGFFAFLGTLNGWESVGLLLGAFLLLLAGYMLLTSFGLQVLESAIIGLIGVGLIIWANANLQGAALMLGVGVTLLVTGIVADRASFIAFGIPVYALGAPLLFAALKLQPSVVILLTVASLIVLIYVLTRVESDISFSLAMDEARGPGLVEGEKHAKRAGAKVKGGAKKVAGKARRSGV